MEMHRIRDGDLAPLPAPAAVVADGAGGGGGLGAGALLQQLVDHADDRLQQAAVEAGGGGLQQLIELRDRRLQAASFFLVWGCSTLIYSMVPNPSSVNPEHIFVGLVVFTIGTGLALLTMAGAAAGRAAARAEGFLRGFF